FGLTLPRRPTNEQVEDAYRVMWDLVGNQSIESLASLPAMQDPEQKAAFRVLRCVAPTAYFFDFNLYTLLNCHQVILCLRHGNFEEAALGYAAIGPSLIARFRGYPQAASFVTLAAELAEHSDVPRVKLRTWVPMWGLGGFWIRPYRDTIEGLRRCFRLGIQ